MRQLHKIHQQQASSNTKTPASCSERGQQKLQLHKDGCTSYYPKTRPAHTDLFWRHKLACTERCVSKYHSSGLVNSQVYTLQTEPDTRQTWIKQGAPALYNQTVVIFRSCGGAGVYSRTLCSHLAPSCNSHPLSHHQLTGSSHTARLVPHYVHSVTEQKMSL